MWLPARLLSYIGLKISAYEPNNIHVVTDSIRAIISDLKKSGN
jgi:hypothetical protein